MPQAGKAPNKLFKPGDWVRRKVFFEPKIGVVLEVSWDTVTIRWEKELDTHTIPYREARWHCVVMRPSHKVRYEKLKTWMVPGTRVVEFFEPSVYVIEEVRGMWMLLRDEVSGVIRFCRAKEAGRFSVHLNRFQKVL